MKKLIQFIIAIAIFSSSTLLSQTTINRSDFELATESNPRIGYTLEPDGISIPEAGENITWDYSTAVDKSSTTFYYTNIMGNSEFPDAQYMNYYNVQFGPFLVTGSETYYKQDDLGIYSLGFKTNSNTFDISTVSGVPGDNLTLNEYLSAYETPRVDISFPMSYSNTITSDIIGVTKFNMTLTPFGLNNTPGELMQFEHFEDEVVGWGKLTVGIYKDQPALLVKREFSIIDSVFMGGAPAPEALLTAFGLVQGQTNVYTRYYFYISDGVTAFNAPAFYIFQNPNETTISSAWRNSQEVYTNNVKNAKVYNAKVFPIPTNENNLTLEFEKNNSDIWSLEIVDMFGKKLHQSQIQNYGLINHSIDLNNNPNGIYFAVVRDNKGEIVFSLDFVK